jgi:hypothetical protein
VGYNLLTQELNLLNFDFPSIRSLSLALANVLERVSLTESKWTLLYPCLKQTKDVCLLKLLISPVQTSLIASWIDVAIDGHPRRLPLLKDSNWIHERREIEQHNFDYVQECLLTQNGFLYEGLTTNAFFIFEKKKEFYLQTAPVKTVLPGIMAKEVKTFCSLLGLKVVESCVRLNAFTSLKACFLTSLFFFIFIFELYNF